MGQPGLEPGLLQQERVLGLGLGLGLQRVLGLGLQRVPGLGLGLQRVLERALEPRAQRVPELREF
jgi:hypothetical protein